MLTVGAFRIDPVYDGVARVPTSFFYPNAPEESLKRAFPNGMVELFLGAFLVRANGRTILMDAGAGPIDRDIFHGGELLSSLAALGVTPADVTDVVFTHLHWDHIGWAAQKGEVVFPNATYRCDQTDFDFFICDEGAARKLVPLQDRLQTWKGDAAVLPGIDAMSTPGHTPGHAVLVLSSGAERALVLGDVAHCPLELEETTLDGFGDVDIELAKRTREAISRELESSGSPALGAHFPEATFGRVVRAEGVRRWIV